MYICIHVVGPFGSASPPATRSSSLATADSQVICLPAFSFLLGPPPTHPPTPLSLERWQRHDKRIICLSGLAVLLAPATQPSTLATARQTNIFFVGPVLSPPPPPSLQRWQRPDKQIVCLSGLSFLLATVTQPSAPATSRQTNNLFVGPFLSSCPCDSAFSAGDGPTNQ